ncbi:hypothetical protein KAU11_03530, partial [Candidatus Babeliales bacterium]|nr:hypothetical protein [Candidatus Babeliales bacterium]
DDVKHLFVDENLVIVDNKIFYSDVNNARDWEKVSCIEKRFPPNDKVTQGKEKGPFYHLF